MPFAELKARSLINDKAHAADQDPDFSSADPRRPAAPAGPYRTLSWLNRGVADAGPSACLVLIAATGVGCRNSSGEGRCRDECAA